MSKQQYMETLLWTGPRVMEVCDTPVPEVAPGEVLLEVSAAGICGSELSGYLGQSSLRQPPLIMGHEAAGRVAQATLGTFADGSPTRADVLVTFNPLVVCGECDRCRVGLTNLCRKRQLLGAHRPGAFARFVAVPAAQCYPLPAHLSATAGSLTEPLACAVRAVSLSRVRPDQSLLILGAGPIGLFCLAVAHALGIQRVYVSDLSASRLKIARLWGAQDVINVRERDVLATVQTFAPGGVDTVIDAVGAGVTRAQAVQAVVPGGRVIFIGLHDEESPLAANYLVRQEVDLSGCFAYTVPDFERAFDLLSQGILQVSPSWLEERPLAEGGAAFAALVDGTVAATKIILRLN